MYLKDSFVGNEVIEQTLKDQMNCLRGQWPPYLNGDLYSGHDEMRAVKCPGVD